MVREMGWGAVGGRKTEVGSKKDGKILVEWKPIY